MRTTAIALAALLLAGCAHKTEVAAPKQHLVVKTPIAVAPEPVIVAPGATPVEAPKPTIKQRLRKLLLRSHAQK